MKTKYTARTITTLDINRAYLAGRISAETRTAALDTSTARPNSWFDEPGWHQMALEDTASALNRMAESDHLQTQPFAVLDGIAQDTPTEITLLSPEDDLRTRQAAAQLELGRCFTRLDRLAAPPKRLQQFDLWVVVHLGRYHSGQPGRVVTAALMIQWQTEANMWRGRTVDAFAALETRWWNARQEAVRCGILRQGSDALQSCTDRFLELQHIREHGRAVEASACRARGLDPMDPAARRMVDVRI